jgi:hypothetical protein
MTKANIFEKVYEVTGLFRTDFLEPLEQVFKVLKNTLGTEIRSRSLVLETLSQRPLTHPAGFFTLNELFVEIVLENQTMSASGKTLAVASTRGNTVTFAVVDDKPDTIELNSYINEITGHGFRAMARTIHDGVLEVCLPTPRSAPFSLTSFKPAVHDRLQLECCRKCPASGG